MDDDHELETDFRSDTVTRPSEAMYASLRRAELGDDVFGDDPTTNALEEEAAELLGMEAALFLPSGTMANNVAIAVSTRPGEEILLMPDAHTYLFEQGGAARLWGVHSHALPGRDGCLEPEQVATAVRPDDPHFPRTALVLLENTHNMGGGRAVPPERLDAIGERCRELGLALHLDGARLFNAAVALGCPPRDLTRSVDSVMVSLSKGLRCPAGSIFASDRERVAAGRRVRKLLGGGMRQTGILAACGRVALADGIPALADDHRRARLLADGLRGLPGVRLTPDPPPTNILLVEFERFRGEGLAALEAGLAARGMRTVNILGERLRLVTHAHITDQGVERCLAAFRELLSR